MEHNSWCQTDKLVKSMSQNHSWQPPQWTNLSLGANKFIKFIYFSQLDL